MSAFSRPNGSFRHRIYSEKGRVPFSKRLCPVCSIARFWHRRFNAKRMVRSENDSVLLPMARFGIELIAKGRIPFSKRLRTPRSAIACRLFLVPMAHFGIESIAKKDGYPSQNDFALFALWLVFGIEGLMQKGWSVQKMTLSFSQWPVSA